MATQIRHASLFDALASRHPEVEHESATDPAEGPVRTRTGRGTRRRSLRLLLVWFGLADLLLFGAWWKLGSPGSEPPTPVEVTAAPRISLATFFETDGAATASVARPTAKEAVPRTARTAPAQGTAQPVTTVRREKRADRAVARSSVSALEVESSPRTPVDRPSEARSAASTVGATERAATRGEAPLSRPSGSDSNTRSSGTAEVASPDEPTVPTASAPERPLGVEAAATEADRRARRLPTPPIPVPEGALDGVAGTVVVRVHITDDGRVSDARILRGLVPEIDGLARTAALSWLYEPALENGVPVAEARNVALRFESSGG